MNAAFTSMIMQRMCQNTRRCRTSQQARIQSVAAVAAWGWTDGDEDLVSAWRQLSPCRHWLALPWRPPRRVALFFLSLLLRRFETIGIVESTSSTWII